jgi:hypothetical protein
VSFLNKAMNILLFGISFHPQQHCNFVFQAKLRHMKNQLLFLLVFVLVAAAVRKAQDTSAVYTQ